MEHSYSVTRNPRGGLLLVKLGKKPTKSQRGTKIKSRAEHAGGAKVRPSVKGDDRPVVSERIAPDLTDEQIAARAAEIAASYEVV